MFDPQPTLTGDVLSLRPLRPTDRESLYAAAKDPLIWEQHPARNRHEQAPFDAYFDDMLSSGGALVVLDRDDVAAGASRYQLVPGADEVEIGWTFLARRLWGGRANAEVKRLMIDHALGTFSRVVLLVAPGNHRSRRAVEKIGAVPAGHRTNRQGEPMLLFAVRRADRPRPGAAD